MKRLQTLLSLLLCLCLLASLLPAAPASADAQTVEEKVAELCAACREQGFTTEYETALWLHDWLIYNADYDQSRSMHAPEGVLLLGYGVCESYAGAYALLLNGMGIENGFLSGTAGQNNEAHIWNLVRLDGVWCQIDVTWDDPIGGGAECHDYFGLTDELMARDHYWSSSGAPACTSLENYYPIRNGALVYSSTEELEALLNAAAADKAEQIELVYIGTDAERSSFNDFLDWYKKSAHVYGVSGYGAKYSGYCCTISGIRYTAAWEPVENQFEEPVDAPAFTLYGPEGSFSLESYRGNGLTLLFLPEGESYTRYFLGQLGDLGTRLSESGVQLLVVLGGCQTPEAVMSLRSVYPDFRYCYGQDAVMWQYLRAVTPGANSASYPVAFVVDGEGQIVYFASGASFDRTELEREALLTGSAEPLPEPGKSGSATGYTGNATLDDLPSGPAKAALTQACAASPNGVVFLTDSRISNEAAGILEQWEANAALYERCGMSLLASFTNVSEQEMAAYPHVIFVEYNQSDFWSMLIACGLQGMSAPTRNSYCLDGEGRFVDHLRGGLLSPARRLDAVVAALDYEAALPAGLTELESEAFAGSGLGSVDLTGAPITAIPARAFAGCEALSFVRIPSSVTQIAPDAFAGCGNVILVCDFNSAAALFAWSEGLPLLCP